MKKEEVSYLEMIKNNEGLDYYKVGNEIRDFINTQRGFRLLKKETKKKDTLIKNLEKKIKTLEIKIEQLKSKTISKNKNKGIKLLNKLKKISKNKIGSDIFKETISKSEEKDIKRYVLRIKTSMEDKQYTKSSFILELIIPKRYIMKCINKLMIEDYLDSEIVNGNIRYYKK